MVINRGRTFSLATLLLLTAFIAGWLGLLRIAPELATIFAFISIPALWRTARAAGRYAHSEMALPLVDRVALFLISQTVVIACLVIPLVCGTIAMWLGWAPAFFLANGSVGQITIFVFGLILGLVAALAAFVVAIHKWGPVRSTSELPSRWLALASGAPAGFFAFCSVVLYGDGRTTTALLRGPASLLPRLVACLIVVPPLLRTIARMTRGRRSVQTLSVKDLMMSLLRDVAFTAGTVLAAVLSGCAVWICFHCLSVHDRHRSPPVIQFWSALGELLAPASAVSIATMVAIYLVQTGFAAEIARIAYAFDADHSAGKEGGRMKHEGITLKGKAPLIDQNYRLDRHDSMD